MTHKLCNLHSHTQSAGAIVDRSAQMTLLDMAWPQSVGIHPWHANEAAFDTLKQLANSPAVVAIGEAGFDRPAPSTDIQTTAFRFQADIAEQTGKPLIIHCVRASDIILNEHRILRPSVKWIVHGFRGKPQEAQMLLKRGIALSLGQKFNPDTAGIIPETELFIETDVSDATIQDVAALVARARGVSACDILDISARNILTATGVGKLTES